MKRERGSVFLVLFSLLLLSVPLAAQESPCASFASMTPLFKAGDLFTPAPSWRFDGCQANITCPNGCEISCTGPTQTSCSSTSTSVTCNGVTTNCPFPACNPINPCVDPCGFCECRANGGGILVCYRAFCEA